VLPTVTEGHVHTGSQSTRSGSSQCFCLSTAELSVHNASAEPSVRNETSTWQASRGSHAANTHGIVSTSIRREYSASQVLCLQDQCKSESHSKSKLQSCGAAQFHSPCLAAVMRTGSTGGSCKLCLTSQPHTRCCEDQPVLSAYIWSTNCESKAAARMAHTRSAPCTFLCSWMPKGHSCDEPWLECAVPLFPM
jgi:hypothetical protein